MLGEIHFVISFSDSLLLISIILELWWDKCIEIQILNPQQLPIAKFIWVKRARVALQEAEQFPPVRSGNSSGSFWEGVKALSIPFAHSHLHK